MKARQIMSKHQIGIQGIYFHWHEHSRCFDQLAAEHEPSGLRGSGA